MIAMLRGRLFSRASDFVVLDVGGVGYQVFVPGPLLTALPVEREIVLHICTIVREDAFLLYGFDSEVSRETFELLRQVTGVGPKIALALLGALTPDGLAEAIAKNDVRTLCKTPGVGKKLAERLCLELENKLPRGFQPVAATRAPAAPDDPLPLALARLEYKKSEIDLVLAAEAVPKHGAAPLELRLKAALAVLMKGL